MSLKPTILAFTLAVLGVLAVVYIQPAEGPAARRAGHEVIPLVSPDAFPVEDIDRITLKRRGESALIFQRNAGGWEQIEPFPVHMDRYRMRQIINAVRAVEVLDRVPADDEAFVGLTLDAVALDPPLARIEFAWSSHAANQDENTISFELGRTGIGGRGYLRRAGEDAVLVVSRHLHEYAVLGDPRGWRDRTLFRDVGVDSDRIVRQAGEERLVLERDRRQWTMIEPVTTRVDENVRDVFMEALGGARAEGFIVDQPHDLSRFGLDPPVASLTVYTTRRGASSAYRVPSAEMLERSDRPARDSESETHEDVQRLLVGSPAGAGTQDRFAKMEGRPTVVRLPADALQRLFIQSAEMVAPTASGTMSADVKAFVINGPDGTLRIDRELERWIAREYDGKEVPAELADGLLSQLTEARAESVSIHEYPRDLEVATVTLLGFDNRPRDTVRIIRDPDTGRWGLENGDNVFRIFPAEIDMPLTPAAFGLPSAR